MKQVYLNRLRIQILGIFLFFFGPLMSVFGQENNSQVTVIIADEFHITKPLTEIFKDHPVPEDYIHPKFEMPDKKKRTPQHFPLAKEGDPIYGNDSRIIQDDAGEVPSLPVKVNWPGQLPGGGFRPYDPSGAVGPSHYIQMVNSTTFRIHDKLTGANLLTGTLGNLWSPATGNNGDPIVMYDKPANRWFLAQFGNSADNKIYIAVSQTSNPLGSWYTYTYTSPDFPDYLKFSVWHDAYYMTSNQGVQKVFAFNRSEILAGTPGARSININFAPPIPSGFFCPLPGDAADGTLPAAGTPCPILSYSDNGWGAGYSDAVNIYNMSVNWVPVTPTATITLNANVATAAFNANYNPSWNDCVQPGTAQKLDGIGGVLMYRAQWKAWPGYNSMVLNWGVEMSATQRGIMWCELRQTGGVWSMYQQGIFSPGGDTRWMGSIAMNDEGAIGMCYIRSNSTTMYPSIYYAGRRACDPINTFPVTETLIEAGTGYQTGFNRVGDYSQLVVDPSDGLTFWGTSEYMGGPSGVGAARTRVFSFNIPTCVTATAGVSIALTSGTNPSCNGNFLSFTATPVNGGTTPSYQWQVNGVNAGSNSPNFSSSTLADDDIVSCIMTSNLPGVLGNPATSNSILVIRVPYPSIAPSATPATICEGSTSNLNANVISTNKLFTTLVGGNGSSGNVFDIIATNTITISSLKMQIITGATQAEVWYKAGGYGNAALASSAGWTQLGTAVSITAAGAGKLTSIPISTTLTIPAGQTYGIVVVCNGSNRYTDGTSIGAIFASNSDIAITQGHGGAGMGGAFSFGFAPRNWNGEVVYTKNAAATYLWSPATGLSSTTITNPNANPSSSQIYSIAVADNNGCTANGSVTLNVNPMPITGSTTASPSSICLGAVTNLAYTAPVALSCNGASQSGFALYYATVAWTTTHLNSNGFINSSTAPDSITMVSSDGLTGSGTTTYSRVIPCSGIVQFNWNYNTPDGAFYDRPRYAINGNVAVEFPGYNTSGANTQNGSFSLAVNAGDTLKLQAYSADNIAGACNIIIKNFIAPIQTVPNQNVYWYNAASGGSYLGNGSITNLPATKGTYSFYAEVYDVITGCTNPTRVSSNKVYVNQLPTVSATATPSSICQGSNSQLNATASNVETDSLFTTLIENNGSGGNAFNIIATKAILIKGFKIHVTSGNQAEVWYKVGGYGNVNFTGTSGWTKLGATVSYTSAGLGNLTNIPITAFLNIPAGSTYGIMIVANGTVEYLDGTSPVGTIFASNPDLSITIGHGGTGIGTYGFVNSPRVWNGEVTYDVTNTISNYAWTPPTNLTNASISNPIANPSSTSIYTVTATDVNGCTKTTSLNLYVFPYPALGTATATPASLCLGAALNLIYTAPAGPQCTGFDQLDFSGTYAPANWATLNTNSNGSVNIASAPASISMISSDGLSGAGSTNYTITVPCAGIIKFNWSYTTVDGSNWDYPRYSINGAPFALLPGYSTSGGSSQSGTFNMLVSAGQTFALQAYSVDNAAGSCTTVFTNFRGPIQLSASQGVTWFSAASGGTNLGTLNPQSHTPATANTFTYYAQISNTANGCTNPTRVATNSVTVNPLPNVTASASSSTICSGNSTTLTGANATSYLWNPGALSGVSVSVSPLATTTYTVTGTGAGGCTKTATITITVNLSPTVGTTVTNATICSGSSTSITGTGASTYTWQPGALSGTTINVSPLTTTTYTVTGTATNGCTKTATRVITVNLTPTVGTTVTNATICSGNSTAITGTGASTYVWQPGALSGTTINVSPLTTTTYTVTGTAANGCTNTALRTITVNLSPTVGTTVTNATICSGNSTAITGTGASTYAWQPGALSGTTINVSPLTTTTYTVTGTAANGCTNTALRTITVNLTPTVGTTVTNATICSGNSTAITGTGASTYAWQPGALSGTTINVSPLTTTTYTVTGTAANGCTNTTLRTITVNLTPTVGTTVTNATICSGNSTAITGTGASTYAWQPGALSGTTINVSPVTTTTYTVTGTAANGCTNTALRTITVNLSPTVGTTVTNASIPCGSSTTITGTGASTYAWQPGSLSGPSVTVSPTTTTTYTVTGTAANGCTKTSTRTITVTGSCGTALTVKLYFEGYYIGAGLMAPVMQNESVAGATASQTDTITVELRNTTSPYAVVASQKVILQTNGNATGSFSTTGTYYIAIKHRNGIQTWSSTPVTLSGSPITYNFSNAISKAYGNNQVALGGGVFGFYSGDIVVDENIDLLDFAALDIDINNFTFGYFPTDINGDGNVDLLDAPIVESNIINFIFSNHP